MSLIDADELIEAIKNNDYILNKEILTVIEPVGWVSGSWNDYDGKSFNAEGIAWIPLPKPYKEG